MADHNPTAAETTQRQPIRSTCVFFTGLSGAGKSTIANALLARLNVNQPVTLLDGDQVRAHLSTGLGFSREDRDTNIHRIAFVAAEVVKHGGLVIAAVIAPYAAARLRARALVAAHGRFLLVHVVTSLTVCESRDSKGLYAKARRGDITAFTGVSDPYEVPLDADLTIDTAVVSVEDAVSQIMDELESSSTRGSSAPAFFPAN